MIHPKNLSYALMILTTFCLMMIHVELTQAQTFDCRNVDVVQEDCEALVALYHSTNGESWTLPDNNWLQTNTICGWKDNSEKGIVACSGTRVTGLDLQSSGLSGSLPSELGNLAQLSKVDLYNNKLSGPLPASLTKLKLTDLDFQKTDLCELDTAAFQTWLGGIGKLTRTNKLCVLQIDKIGPTTIVPGRSITYTIMLTNLSSSTNTTNVVISDSLPNLVTGNDYRQTITLNTGQTFSATISGVVAANAPISSTITNMVSYSYTGGSGSDSVTTRVVQPNREPIFASTPLTMAQVGVAYRYDIQVNDSEKVVISATTRPSWLSFMDQGNNTATLSGTPTITDLGTSTVRLQAVDTTNLSSTVSFSLRVAAPPKFTSTPITTATQDLAYNYQITAADPEVGDSLVISATTRPTWLTVVDKGDGTATLSGTPTGADVGSHEVSLTVTDSAALSDSQAFTINVADVPDPPNITTIPVVTATVSLTYSYVLTFVDLDGDAMLLQATTVPTWLKLVDVTANSARLTGIPTSATLSQLWPIALTVNDTTGLSSSQRFTITVIPNTVPQFMAVSLPRATEAISYSYTLTATDADLGDRLVISRQTLPPWLTLVDTGNGTARLTGRPTNAHVGPDQVISLLAQDLSGLTATLTISLTVHENITPTFRSRPVITGSNKLTYSYRISVTDPDLGDKVSLTAANLPDWLTLTDFGQGAGQLFSPANAVAGSYPIQLMATDLANQTAQQSFTLTIQNDNIPPRFVSRPTTTATVGVTYSYQISTSRATAAITITASTLPAWLTLTDNNDGTAMLSGLPTSEHLGLNQVVLTITDTEGLTDTQTFNINVSALPINLPDGLITTTVSFTEGGKLLAPDGFVHVSIPPQAVTDSIVIGFVYQDSTPDTGTLTVVDKKAFQLIAFVNGVPIDTYRFLLSATLVITYAASDDILTETMSLQWWNGTAWVQDGIQDGLNSGKSLTSQVNHFTLFALLAQQASPRQLAYLPLLLKQEAAVPTPTSTATDVTGPTATATPSVTATPSERPTTQPITPTPTKPVTPNLPDLRVDSFKVIDNGNGSYRLEMTGRNQSATAVPFGNNFYFAVYVDDLNQEPITFWGVQAAWFGPGQGYTVSAELRADEIGSGEHTVFAWIDPYNTVMEQDENNNIISQSVLINGSVKTPTEFRRGGDTPKPTPTVQP